MQAYEIASLGMRAILYEVSVTPKPGLVDRDNSGAHDDMDYFTFMASASALSRGLYKIADLAGNWRTDSLRALFDSIRPIGMDMETAMFRATDGINTHKGMIFNMGILIAAASYYSTANNGARPSAEALSEIVSKMTTDICSSELGKGKAKTYGEKLYVSHGIKGIRGEVESGYQTVLSTSVPVFRTQSLNHNDLCLQMLFALMTKCEDSNILARHDMDKLRQVRMRAAGFLAAGGMRQPNAMSQVRDLDRLFIKERISPGGSADLLAVSIFMAMMEGYIK
jgi:triphosphoribosyl-dephospho-CoA synthase